MVRALLEGRKTQTRRVPTERNTVFGDGKWPRGLRLAEAETTVGAWPNSAPCLVCKWDLLRQPTGERLGVLVYPRVQPGDRLWVREAWRTWRDDDAMSPQGILDLMDRDDDSDWRPDIEFTADGEIIPRNSAGQWQPGRLRAGMHLPRRLSRLTLVVTEVRVQRLQVISEGDAWAEGVDRLELGPAPILGHSAMTGPIYGHPPTSTYAAAYAALWDDINGDGAWALNPFVIATTFTVHHCNIDRLEAPHG